MSESIFEKIIRREIPAKIIYEDDQTIAIEDINPQAPAHYLVIPKKPIERISDISAEDISLMGTLIDCARKIAKEKGFEDYRLVFNNGAGAGQTVFHIHLHLLAGRPMAWPPG